MPKPANPKTNEAELAVAYRGPAVLANRFYVSHGPLGVRIAFAEQPSPDAPPIFRNAVAMSQQDGITLYKLLQTLLKEAEPETEKSEPAPDFKPELVKAND